MAWFGRATLAALLLSASPAAAIPVDFRLVLTETSPAAHYVGSFSIDSAVLGSGKAINLAPIGIDLTLAGFSFTGSSLAGSQVILGDAGLESVDANLVSAEDPDVELSLLDAAAAGDPPLLIWRLLESRGTLRSGTFAFALAVPEPMPLLLLSASVALLRFRWSARPHPA